MSLEVGQAVHHCTWTRETVILRYIIHIVQCTAIYVSSHGERAREKERERERERESEREREPERGRENAGEKERREKENVRAHEREGEMDREGGGGEWAIDGETDRETALQCAFSSALVMSLENKYYTWINRQALECSCWLFEVLFVRCLLYTCVCVCVCVCVCIRVSERERERERERIGWGKESARTKAGER